ncbi:MAG: hypothetical protein HYT94_01905 [Parcubacteria group bacterium]|nr:hypothetical protein [Parcubacteria group bacterium]
MANVDKSTETGNNKTQSAVVAALVIGLLVGFFIGRSWGETPDDEDSDNGIKIEETASTTKDADVSVKAEGAAEGAKETKKEAPASVSNTSITGTLAVADQQPGASASVSKVTLSAAGWVVVREDTGSGMGNILGAQWLPTGTHENVTVDLLRKTEAKKNYFVVLHGDNGDKKFDKAADLEIVIGGKAVSGVFSAK